MAWEVTPPSEVNEFDAVPEPPPLLAVWLVPPLPPVALLAAEMLDRPVCVSVKLETALPAVPAAPVPEPLPAFPPVADWLMDRNPLVDPPTALVSVELAPLPPAEFRPPLPPLPPVWLAEAPRIPPFESETLTAPSEATPPLPPTAAPPVPLELPLPPAPPIAEAVTWTIKPVVSLAVVDAVALPPLPPAPAPPLVVPLPPLPPLPPAPPVEVAVV